MLEYLYIERGLFTTYFDTKIYYLQYFFLTTLIAFAVLLQVYFFTDREDVKMNESLGKNFW